MGDKGSSTWAVISRSWDQRTNLYFNPGTSGPEHLKQNPNYCAKCPLLPIALSRNVYASCLFEKQLRWFTFQMSRRGRDELGGWQVPHCLNYHLLSPRAGFCNKMKSWGKPGQVCQLLWQNSPPMPNCFNTHCFFIHEFPSILGTWQIIRSGPITIGCVLYWRKQEKGKMKVGIPEPMALWHEKFKKKRVGGKKGMRFSITVWEINSHAWNWTFLY